MNLSGAGQSRTPSMMSMMGFDMSPGTAVLPMCWISPELGKTPNASAIRNRSWSYTSGHAGSYGTRCTASSRFGFLFMRGSGILRPLRRAKVVCVDNCDGARLGARVIPRHERFTNETHVDD